MYVIAELTWEVKDFARHVAVVKLRKFVQCSATFLAAIVLVLERHHLVIL
jgi:hypothetical protein